MNNIIAPQTIAEQIEANNQILRGFIAEFDTLKLMLETSNKLLTSFLDTFEQIFLRDPEQYSYEDIDLYCTACRFLGRQGIIWKVEEHLNKMPV